MIKLVVEKSSSYGNEYFKIKNKTKKEAWKKLTGKKTIDKKDKEALKKLTGKKVEIVEPEKQL